jgi:hypothetical protein
VSKLSQPLAGRLPAQTQPPPRPSWARLLYKRCRSTQGSSDRVAKHVKCNHHLSLPTIISIDTPLMITRTTKLPQPQPVLLPYQNLYLHSKPHNNSPLMQLLDKLPLNNTSSQPLPTIRYGCNLQQLIHTAPPNNKTIFDVEYLHQCKIKFEPPRH